VNTDDELSRLRKEYEVALDSYTAACAELNRYVITGRQPSSEELQREEQLRQALHAARRRYLEAWRKS
jgi:hypothetical protein